MVAYFYENKLEQRLAAYRWWASLVALLLVFGTTEVVLIAPERSINAELPNTTRRVGILTLFNGTSLGFGMGRLGPGM